MHDSWHDKTVQCCNANFSGEIINRDSVCRAMYNKGLNDSRKLDRAAPTVVSSVCLSRSRPLTQLQEHHSIYDVQCIVLVDLFILFSLQSIERCYKTSCVLFLYELFYAIWMKYNKHNTVANTMMILDIWSEFFIQYLPLRENRSCGFGPNALCTHMSYLAICNNN